MLKRCILWDYTRGSWQYDVVVGIILLFIFVTPREWFGDQPRIPNASSITMISSGNGVSAFFIQADLVAGLSEEQRSAKVNELLQIRTGNKRLTVASLEPVHNSEGDLEGYMAFARP
jgi:hypothetical protein